MTIADIKKLIANDESRVLELKKSTGELVKAMQTLCAFLNSDGGWLFFGITPKLEILGQNVTDNTQREIAHEITKIEPAIKLPLEIVEVPERPGNFVIGIHVEAPNSAMRLIPTTVAPTTRWRAPLCRCPVLCLRNDCGAATPPDLRGKAKHLIFFALKIWTKDRFGIQ